MYQTAERIGDRYFIYHNGRTVAVCTSLDSFLATARLLAGLDPANDGPEVAIINREAQIKAEEFFGIL